MFQDQPAPQLFQTDRLRLAAADFALEKIVDTLVEKADEIMQAINLPLSTNKELTRILQRFRLVVPAQDCKGLVDILKVAWRAFNDVDFWKNDFQVFNQKDLVLKELILKNIEIFEVEQILRGTYDS